MHNYTSCRLPLSAPEAPDASPRWEACACKARTHTPCQRHRAMSLIGPRNSISVPTRSCATDRQAAMSQAAPDSPSLVPLSGALHCLLCRQPAGAKPQSGWGSSMITDVTATRALQIGRHPMRCCTASPCRSPVACNYPAPYMHHTKACRLTAMPAAMAPPSALHS